MTNWIISSSILIIAVLFLRRILKGRISLRIQYAIWLLVAVRLLIPFNFGSTFLSIENYTSQLTEYETENNVTDAVASPPVIENEYKVKIYDNVVPQGTSIHADRSESLNDSVDRNNILKIIWIVGMIGVGSTFVISNLIFTRKVKFSRRRVIADCELPVYISDKIDTPCLFHIFRPTIYITNNVAKHEKLLIHTISHELTHYHQGDLIWNIVRCICLIIHWYNPLVWIAAIISKQDCELACDETTIKKLGEQDRLEYGKTLIQLTSHKTAELFVASTTMTSGKRVLKERIHLIAKKPRTTFIGCTLLIVTLLIVTGCTFTSARSEDITASENTENISSEKAEPGKTEQSSESAAVEIKYYDEPEENKVCLAVMPDGISKAGGDYRYIIPEDQVVWTDRYKAMRSIVSGDGKWKDDERSMGIWTVFNDEWTCITDQGFIYDFSKRAELDTPEVEEFYQMCLTEARDNMINSPVRPEEITTIRAATLEYNGAYTVMDEGILSQLQRNLSASEEIRGGAACPFTASLYLEFENGKGTTIYLATDTCNAWMSSGVYYEYFGYADTEEIYNIFQENAVEVRAEESANIVSNAEYLITHADVKLREGYIEAKLTYIDNSEVGWNYYTDNPWESDAERDALAQAALKELYTLTGFNVKECTYTTDGRSKFIFGKSAEYIGKSIAFYTRDYGFTLYGNETPYMGFVNARRVHYSDVQQLDSPYGKEEFSGHAAIPTWFLKHSGIYQGEKITGFEAFNIDDTVFTHIKLFFNGGYYIVVMDEEIESVAEIMGPYYE